MLIDLPDFENQLRHLFMRFIEAKPVRPRSDVGRAKRLCGHIR
jgi:hypothetical protein